MSSTITLQATTNWASPMVKYLPSNQGAYLQPALSSANLVKQVMLAPPFAWNWNRFNASFTCIAGLQDYTVTVADFGWIENASIQDIAPPLPVWYSLQTVNSLTLDTAQSRPQSIAPDNDGGVGVITFRLMPVPDLAYPVTITYQKRASLFTGMSNTWSPIPDHLSHVYQMGFLALSMMHSDDPRFPIMNQKFMSSLLAVAEGLTEIERSIFIGEWSALTGMQADQTRTSQGINSRQY